MGEVYEGHDEKLGRSVALKVLKPEFIGDEEYRRRFLREARSAAAVTHPYIAAIHEADEIDGTLFIAMEFVDGRTLRSHLAKGPIDIDDAQRYAIEVTEGLAHAHQAKLVHRDLKPDNIMIASNGHVKILDFGLAKVVEKRDEAATLSLAVEQPELTAAGAVLGTPAYMSPEQALGKEIDERTDIFALGAVVYELATGQRAFPGNTTAEVFDAILNKPHVAPASLNRKVPAGLEQIISKALEKERDLRYQSVADVGTDLKRLQRDSGARAATPPIVASKGRRRWVGIAVAFVLVAAATWYFGPRERSGGSVGQLTTRQLTSYVGVERGPSWSPDGNFFAYYRSAFGPYDIFVESLEGGDPFHLVESPADDEDPRWSPNNKWIAFRSNREGSWSIYLIPPLGGNIRKLTDIGATYHYLGQHPWSPDSRSFLFARADSAGLKSIWRVGVETGIETRLTFPSEERQDRGASWSPDGVRIAFARGHGSGTNLMVMSPEGQEVREVLADGYGNEFVSWSPDSKSLVFHSNRGGDLGIWTLRIGSRDPIRLTSGAGRTLAPTVSRKGQILYNTASHQTDLYIMNLESGEERRLTAHTEDNFGAAFSPDGKRVAYHSSRTGNSEIFVLDLDSGEERQLTDHPDRDSGADWSPDGREIVFVSERPAGEEDRGSSRVWTMPAGGGVPQLLCDRPIRSTPKWSPVDSLVGFVSAGDSGPALWVLDRTDRSVRKVLDDVVDFEWYIDERHVIVATVGHREMRAVALETGKYTTLLKDRYTELAVALDGRAVSYCSVVSHPNRNLHVMRLAVGADGLPRPVGEPEQTTYGKGEWHVHNGDWSPDGRHVVYTRDTDGGNLFLLDGVFTARE